MFGLGYSIRLLLFLGRLLEWVSRLVMCMFLVIYGLCMVKFGRYFVIGLF